MGTSTPQQVAAGVVRAIERNKVEIAVAPVQTRALAHLGLASPRIAMRAVSGGDGQQDGRPGSRGAGRQALNDETGGHSVSTDSFGARDTLEGLRHRVRDLPARCPAVVVRRRPAALLDQGPARERAATRGRRVGHAATTSRRSPSWDAKAEPSEEIPFQPARVLMQDFTGVPALVDLAAMRDAMEELGGEPRQDRPAGPRGPDHRPLGPGRRVRQRARLRHQRRPRLRAKRRALRVPALGPAGVRQPPRRPPGDRDLPPGEPRVPGPGRLQARAGRQ